MSRRNFLILSGGLSTVAIAFLYGRGMMAGQMMHSKEFQKASDNQNSKFFNPLFIPPQIEGKLIDNTLHYDLYIQNGYKEFFNGLRTPTYGINGDYLGPTIRLINDSNVSINWHNNLNEPVAMHGHGMHLPATEDGNVHQTIAPKSSWSAKYRVKQKACTNWYHPHTLNRTSHQVLMGLGGFIIIDDEESKHYNLPNRYGIDDIPLIVQDRTFSRNGNFVYPKNMMTVMHGFMGDRLLINGTVAPFIEVENNLLRLRLLNGSNARNYNFAIKEGLDMTLIAGDNSFLEKPVSIKSLLLSPAERAEVVIDLRDYLGKTVYLIDLETNARVLEIRVTKKFNQETTIPKKLTELEAINISNIKRKREFVLGVAGPGRLVINGKTMDKNRIDERIKLGEYEIWEVINRPMGMMRMGMVHNFHMHGHHFRVLARDGNRYAVKPWERGYKDTVRIDVGERVTLLVRHEDYANYKVPYMYHCHILEHEDAGMMGQFTVEA